MIRTDHPDDISAIAGAVSAVINWDADHCVARVQNNVNGFRTMGGVIYSNYTGVGGSIVMSVAGLQPNWINRDLLWAVFDYPFTQCNCRKLFAQIKDSNKRSLDFVLKVGFKAETVIEHVYPDGDMLLLSMYRDDCKWLTLKGNIELPPTLVDTENGQISQSAPAA